MLYVLGFEPIVFKHRYNKSNKLKPKEEFIGKVRLEKMFKKISDISNHIWNIDDGIYAFGGLGKPDFIKYDEYYEIVKISHYKDTLTVITDSYDVMSDDTDYFIANYDPTTTLPNKSSAEKYSKIIENRITNTKPTTEIHYWVKFDDTWMIGDNSILLLGRSKLSL